MGNFRKAKAKYKNALSKADSAKDDIAKANVLNSLASLFHAQDKYEDADRYLCDAKTLTADEGSKEAKTHHANTLHLQGYNFYVRAIVAELEGKPKDASENLLATALEHYKHAKEERKANGDRAGLSNTIRDIGKVAFVREKYPEAKKNFEESLSITKEIGNIPGEAASRGELGRVISRMIREHELSRKSPKDAVEELEKALSMYKESRNEYGEAVINKYFGDYWLDQNEEKEARKFYEKSIEGFVGIKATGAVEHKEAKKALEELKTK